MRIRKYKYDEEYYFLKNGSWYDASFLKVPNRINEKLNSVYAFEIKQEKFRRRLLISVGKY